MISHDAIHADPAALGTPFVAFVLRGRDGNDRRVTVWAPEPWDGACWRGWLHIEPHPQFHPPHRLIGERPWQVLAETFDQVGEFVSYTRLQRVCSASSTGVPPMTDHEPVYADPAALGTPFVRFLLRDAAGGDHEVVIWAPPPTPLEAGRIFRGWLYVEGHPEFGRPRRVLGEGPWQPVSLAFKVVDDFAAQRSLTRVV